MKKSKKIYVAYGSNLCISQMCCRCPEAKIIGSGTLENHQLEFWGSGRGVATVTPKNGSSVPVGLWEISQNDEANLDIYEGYPNLYRKEDIEVILDSGEKITGMVYLMNEFYHGKKQPKALPTSSYLNTILTGYSDFRLDTNILTEAYKKSLALASRR